MTECERPNHGEYRYNAQIGQTVFDSDSDRWHKVGVPPVQFVTKDSGERQEYASGMKRDTERGKPRFDLLKARGVPYNEQMLTRFAALMARGAEKYGDRNWEKADSLVELERYVSSGERHMQQWAAGEADEDHAAAVMFNLMAAETLKWKLEQAEDDDLWAGWEEAGYTADYDDAGEYSGRVYFAPVGTPEPRGPMLPNQAEQAHARETLQAAINTTTEHMSHARAGVWPRWYGGVVAKPLSYEFDNDTKAWRTV